jgi:hypothetical protein
MVNVLTTLRYRQALCLHNLHEEIVQLLVRFTCFWRKAMYERIIGVHDLDLWREMLRMCCAGCFGDVSLPGA